MNSRRSIWQKLQAYKLHNNVYVVIMLAVSVAGSILIYVSPLRESRFVPELALACATSLLASIFQLVSDIYVKYKNLENDKLLEGIHEFGINDLHFNKQQLLEHLLKSCDREVWVSGYRLILTSKIAPSLSQAIRQGANLKLLISPPWMDGFKLVYGENDRVIDNYCKVFSAIAKACREAGRPVEEVCEVRFTQKPLFSDTYKVDLHIVTGPYMHNRDEDDHRITANNFFTYNLIKKSRLYNLVENEYMTLWEEADSVLVWEAYAKASEQIRIQDLREKEKIELMQEASQPLNHIVPIPLSV
ncbi:hypothetical protein [Paenibacillus barengoltzii]|uniref:SMODS and SLOG-associating 2TM effector domain-containing protein n=2 Tax=Paenibacillus barengoltzii TaxID=343517 RepID=A0ABY1LWZ2_9BACL|nr:hypothetical protein [Paenibacillus barengoltzii]SMF22909.1 hypothetical protein SAMN02744124_01968 [Paenibacillus barengoltzii J12]